ncbi:MAG: hypothetical protein IJM81_03620 [Prevotella sp.]|nr:hypothetical protein [Prevotella sp.]
MKKLLIIFVGLLTLAVTGCKEERRTPQADNQALRANDSLQRIIAQKDNEVNDMMETLNQIQDGFREINEAENRVTLAESGENADKKQQLMENIQFITTTMKRNKELINKLQQQLRESTFKGDQIKQTLENTIANFTQQLAEKDKELQNLRAQLEAKDIHIAELDKTITDLNTNVSNLQTESSQKTETINAQDKQLNTAWYVFGTKKELKEQHILDGNRVLQSNFNKSYFTKIDIRTDKEIKLYSKSAKILTQHSASSYTLQPDANRQYVLRITNPQLFWSTSKYLVVLVK